MTHTRVETILGKITLAIYVTTDGTKVAPFLTNLRREEKELPPSVSHHLSEITASCTGTIPAFPLLSVSSISNFDTINKLFISKLKSLTRNFPPDLFLETELVTGQLQWT